MTIERFLFNQNFGGAEDTFSVPSPVQKELEGKERQKYFEEGFAEGFQDGFRKGLEQKLSEREEALFKQTSSIASAIVEAQQNILAQHYSSLHIAAQLVCFILPKIFPLLEQKIGEDNLRQVLSGVLRVIPEGKCVLAVSPLMEKQILSFLDSHQGVPSHYKVVGDEAVAFGDCKITFDSSGLEYMKQKLLQEVDSLVKGLLSYKDNPQDNQMILNKGEHGNDD